MFHNIEELEEMIKKLESLSKESKESRKEFLREFCSLVSKEFGVKSYFSKHIPEGTVIIGTGEQANVDFLSPKRI